MVQDISKCDWMAVCLTVASHLCHWMHLDMLSYYTSTLLVLVRTQHWDMVTEVCFVYISRSIGTCHASNAIRYTSGVIAVKVLYINSGIYQRWCSAWYQSHSEQCWEAGMCVCIVEVRQELDFWCLCLWLLETLWQGGACNSILYNNWCFWQSYIMADHICYLH